MHCLLPAVHKSDGFWKTKLPSVSLARTTSQQWDFKDVMKWECIECWGWMNGMSVGEEAVHLGRCGSDIYWRPGGEEEIRCGGSISGVESPETITGPRQHLEKQRWVRDAQDWIRGNEFHVFCSYPDSKRHYRHRYKPPVNHFFTQNNTFNYSELYQQVKRHFGK